MVRWYGKNNYMNLTQKDKSALKFAGGALAVFLAIAVFGLVMKRVRGAKPEDNFTPSQKAFIKQMGIALGEIGAAREELEKTKAEIRDMVSTVRASIFTEVPATNQHIDWLVNGAPNTNGNGGVIYIVNDGKPILWGLRADGRVFWKPQP